MESKERHIVLTGDIISSLKNYKDDEWRVIQKIIDELNKRYRNYLPMPMIIYAGDSIGAVINDIEAAYTIGMEIYMALHPVAFRYNIVADKIEYGMDTGNFAVLQGEALWKSQRILRKLEKDKKTFALSSGNQRLDDTVNHITNLLHKMKSSWSAGQLSITQSYRKLNNQKMVAEELEMSQQYVSKVLKATSYNLVYESESYLKTILRECNKHALP